MALSGYQPRWLRQPSGLVRVNEGHWLANRLIFAHTGIDAFVWHGKVAPAALPLAPVAGGGNGRLGSIQQATPDGTNYNWYTIPAMAGNGFTFGLWQHGVAGSTQDALMSIGNSSSSDGARVIRRTTGETFQASRISPINDSANATSGGYKSGVWQQVAGRFSSATLSAVALDGVVTETSGNSRIATTVNAVYLGTSWVGSAATNTASTAIRGLGPSWLVNSLLSDDELVRLHAEQLDDPWSMFAPEPIWVPVSAGGGDVTVALSGQAATASAGTAVPSSTVAASGQAATCGTGTLATSSTVPTAGQAATASAGTVTQAAAPALSGQTATASAGTIAPSRTLPLSGQAVTASAGAISYAADGNVTLALSGQAVAASAGTLAVTRSTAVSGAEAAASAGTAVPGIGIPAIGSAVAGSAGTLALGIVVPLAGQGATASAGTVTYAPAGSVVVALTGQTVAASAGTLTFGASVPLDEPIFSRTASAQSRRIGRGSVGAAARRIGNNSIDEPAAG